MPGNSHAISALSDPAPASGSDYSIDPSKRAKHNLQSLRVPILPVPRELGIRIRNRRRGRTVGSDPPRHRCSRHAYPTTVSLRPEAGRNVRRVQRASRGDEPHQAAVSCLWPRA